MAVEVPYGQEAEFWIPSLTMRPHHFYREEVSEALLRKEDPWVIAKSSIALLVNDYKADMYDLDVIGKSIPSWKKNAEKKLTKFYHQLGQLSDDSTIKFSLQKDGICDTCDVGNHCLALNWPRQSTAVGEAKALRDILGGLHRAGFKSGRDYIQKPEVVTLYDYGNQGLDLVNPVPTREVFTSAIVKVGSLRAIS